MYQRRKNARAGVKAKAEEYLDRARELYGFSNSDPALLRGALIKARKSLLLDPENYETLILLGDIFTDFDDPKFTAQALRHYERAIAVRPEDPAGYEGKASLLMYWLHRPHEAEILARKALALSVHNGEVQELLEFRYTTLIDILVGRKKYGPARWLIRRALRDCPSEFMRGVVELPLKEIESSDKRTHKSAVRRHTG
jgi:tetratricopeptide (TPR) repeat protein